MNVYKVRKRCELVRRLEREAPLRRSAATGEGADLRYELVVADADGFNPITVVGSPEPLLSPAWSPDGERLAYVSFEKGNSAIYVQDVTTGARDSSWSRGSVGGASRSTAGGDGAHRIEHEQAADPREAVFTLAVDRGWILLELTPDRATLEDVFVHLTGRGLRDG